MSVYHEGISAHLWGKDRCSNPYEGVIPYVFFKVSRNKERERNRDEWYRGWDARDFEERQKYPMAFKGRLSVVPSNKS